MIIMSGSVAGQIRIDFLTNIARFNADMKSGARDGIGGFVDEYDRAVKKVASQKSIAESIAKEKASWKSAMDEVRKDMNLSRTDSLKMMSLANMNAARDPALEAETRRKSMIPWGNSYRVELSREAAETAARIGHEMGKVKSAWGEAMGELSRERLSEMGGLLPMGGGLLGSAVRWMGSHPILATGGAALAIGGSMAYSAEKERDSRAREVDVRMSMFGQSARDTSRLMAAGFNDTTLSRYMRSLGDQTEEQQKAFSKLQLNPGALSQDSLIDSLEKVRQGFEKLENPADRASVAMHLFGKGGNEVQDTLREMKRHLDTIGTHEIIDEEDISRVKAWDDSWKEVTNTMHEASLALASLFGSQTGIGTATARGFSDLGFVPLGFSNMRNRSLAGDGRTSDEWYVDNRDELERYAAVLARRAADDANIHNTGLLAKYNVKDEERRQQAMADVKVDSKKKEDDAAERQWEKDYAEQQRKWQDTLQQAETLKDQSRSPEQKYQDEAGRIDRLHNRRLLNEDEYARISRKNLDNYYREAYNLDRKRLLDSLKTPVDKYQEQTDAMKGMGFTLDQYNQLDEKARGDLRKELGISDTLGDYKREMEKLRQAETHGVITPEESVKRRKELRKKASGEMSADAFDVSPSAAMSIASTEAYNVIARGMIGSEREQALQKANDLLDKMDEKLRTIEQNTRVANNNAAQVFRIN